MTFKDYMTLNHENKGPISPIVYTTSQLEDEQEYNKDNFKPTDSFKMRGQVKLFITEFQYLNRIYNHLINDTPKLLIYIGSAPGIHLLKLMEKFHNPTLNWLLYDKAKFDNRLMNPEIQAKYNITVVQDFFTEDTVKSLVSSSSIYRNYEKHVLSDIRFTLTESPSTEDLLRDYAIENSLVLGLQPTTAHLKWRYPFLEKDQELVLDRVNGSHIEEWIQPFAKETSSELRLFMTGPEYFIKQYSTEDIRLMERKMAAYKLSTRFNPRAIKPEHMLLTSCRCNDCSLLNMLAVECKKNNIILDVRTIMEACGYS